MSTSTMRTSRPRTGVPPGGGPLLARVAGLADRVGAGGLRHAAGVQQLRPREGLLHALEQRRGPDQHDRPQAPERRGVERGSLSSDWMIAGNHGHADVTPSLSIMRSARARIEVHVRQVRARRAHGAEEQLQRPDVEQRPGGPEHAVPIDRESLPHPRDRPARERLVREHAALRMRRRSRGVEDGRDVAQPDPVAQRVRPRPRRGSSRDRRTRRARGSRPFPRRGASPRRAAAAPRTAGDRWDRCSRPGTGGCSAAPPRSRRAPR